MINKALSYKITKKFILIFALNNIQTIKQTSGFRGVVVITSALHAEGPQFDPGRNHVLPEKTSWPHGKAELVRGGASR